MKIKAETPPEKLIIDIPELKIEKNEGYDIVSIKDCHFTTEVSKPRIPYIIFSQIYPKNYKVQRVIMLNKNNLESFSGLNIPKNYPVSPNVPNPTYPTYEEIGWYPKLEYDWNIIENFDGSNKLLITIFPFYYNVETKEAKFYRKFEFKVDYVYSPVKINYLYLEKASYDINEEVNFEVEVENTDKESKNLIVSSVIKKEDGEIIDSFDLQELKNLKGKGNLNLLWKNQNKKFGRFLFEVSVKDLDGTVYDTTNIVFSIGLPLIEITKFNFSKDYFNPGENLNFVLEFTNKGGEKTDGTINIKFMDKEKVLKEINKDFFNLERDKTYSLSDIWETQNTSFGNNYYVIATIYYYGTTSQSSVKLTTNRPPNANFTYSPSTIYLTDEVNFDASNSQDMDNNIVKYQWDFGDGWTAEGKLVIHKYEKVGTYFVTLKVIDDAESESKITKKIEVLEKKPPTPPESKIIIRLYIGKTTYYVNDEIKTMDTSPIILEGRTLLPIRYVAEALGANVGWDGTEKKVTITFKDKFIELWIGNNTARVNGEYKYIDPSNLNVKPIIISGRTMLPIRFIAENLGCKVDWDPNLKEVKITYPGD
jgi:PKD repeat protein